MKAVSEKASGKTKKKMKIPALSIGIVTMPMEYLIDTMSKVSVTPAKRVRLEHTHITPKIKWTTARIRTRIMTEPRLGRTTPYPMQTMSSMKKLMLFRAAFSRATAHTSERTG